VEYLIDHLGCDLFIELGPGGVLAGLVGRIRKGTACISVADRASLDAAAQTLKAIPGL
jgi:[acyl-carrier-protein] S-malonyltransferase